MDEIELDRIISFCEDNPAKSREDDEDGRIKDARESLARSWGSPAMETTRGKRGGGRGGRSGERRAGGVREEEGTRSRRECIGPADPPPAAAALIEAPVKRALLLLLLPRPYPAMAPPLRRLTFPGRRPTSATIAATSLRRRRAETRRSAPPAGHRPPAADRAAQPPAGTGAEEAALLRAKFPLLPDLSPFCGLPALHLTRPAGSHRQGR